ncbi:MAG: hypothetical protein ACOVLC_11845 [Flavobacterium sp.]
MLPIEVEILFEAFSASKRLERKAGIAIDGFPERWAQYLLMWLIFADFSLF